MGSSPKPKTEVVYQPAPAPQYGSAMQNSTTTTGQSFTPWASAQPTYDSMAALMNQQAAAGPQYVGPSGYTQQAWGAMQGAIPGMQGATDAALGNYNYLSSAADVANNPYVQGMMANNAAAANRALTEQYLPAIQNDAQAAGGMGGSRQGVAQAMAVDRTAQSLAEANNALAMGAYSQGLGAQQAALSGLGGLQQGMLAPAAVYGQMGQQEEAYQQAALDAPWVQLQNLGASQQYLNPLGTLSGTSTASGTSASGPQGAYGPAPNKPAPASTPSYPSSAGAQLLRYPWLLAGHPMNVTSSLNANNAFGSGGFNDQRTWTSD